MPPLDRWLVTGLLFAVLSTSANPATAAVTPQQLFDGYSEGTGSLTMLFGDAKPFHVESRGTVQADGRFRLDQTITFEGEKPKQRHWIIETVEPGTYAGTLSDAAGTVSGTVEGNRLTLCYRIRGAMFMHQTLTLMPDGVTIQNIDRISLLGITIGRLHETILRAEPLLPDSTAP